MSNVIAALRSVVKFVHVLSLVNMESLRPATPLAILCVLFTIMRLVCPPTSITSAHTSMPLAA